MSIPVVPSQSPAQSQIVFPHVTSPYTSLWWTNQTISDIPSESVGWLVSAGWTVVGIRYDESTTPPTPYYNMARQSLQNWYILQSLLNSWTIAYNDARDANQTRYNEVIANWTQMLSSSQAQFSVEAEQQNAHVSLYLGNLATYMDEVESLIVSNQDELDAAIGAANAMLSTSESDYAGFKADYTSVLALLPSDFTLHQATATGYLTGLGATELARINEAFDASLAVQLQQLVDRGLYSSELVAGVTARNARDRSQEIAALNDRLAREKLENERSLYSALTAVRQATLLGKERLYTLGQELLRYRLATKMDNARAIVEHRHRVIVELMNAKAARLAGLEKTHADNMRLMAYQLDERNKLLTGLYGFVEARTDVGPTIENLAQICTSLGDAGGGWVTP